MLLQFVQKRLRKEPSTLAPEDIDAPLVAAFLDDLEATRGVTARTRNLRLTAELLAGLVSLLGDPRVVVKLAIIEG